MATKKSGPRKNRARWDKRFMDLATSIGEWSEDRSRQVGCVIVGPSNEIRATGYNGFPRGVNGNLDCRHERPAKYKWTEHAERNAIYNAASSGVSIAGCRMYVPWFPCVDCARAIIQSGISELVVMEPDWNDPKWGEDFNIAKVMFEEARVNVRLFES